MEKGNFSFEESTEIIQKESRMPIPTDFMTIEDIDDKHKKYLKDANLKHEVIKPLLENCTRYKIKIAIKKVSKIFLYFLSIFENL